MINLNSGTMLWKNTEWSNLIIKKIIDDGLPKWHHTLLYEQSVINNFYHKDTLQIRSHLKTHNFFTFNGVAPWKLWIPLETCFIIHFCGHNERTRTKAMKRIQEVSDIKNNKIVIPNDLLKFEGSDNREWHLIEI